MNFDPAVFDPSQMRLGEADKLSDTPVSAATIAADDDGSVDPKYRAKATEAAIKFESFFIGHMLHQMRSSTKALSSDGSKDKINDDMLDMADNLVADQLAGQRAFGVADAILRQLLPAANTNAAAAAAGGAAAGAAAAAAEGVVAAGVAATAAPIGVAESQNFSTALNLRQ